MGHRISVDIDLFSDTDFDPRLITEHLQQKYYLETQTVFDNSIIYKIEYPEHSKKFIKVDIIKYSYPLIDQVIEQEGIRMLSKKDIIPMKLSAIGNRGAKKDFFDIYFLLKEFPLAQMFELFREKFPQVNLFHIVKSLGYFNDAETDINPKMIQNVGWEEVKKEIQAQIKQYL